MKLDQVTRLEAVRLEAVPEALCRAEDTSSHTFLCERVNTRMVTILYNGESAVFVPDAAHRTMLLGSADHRDVEHRASGIAQQVGCSVEDALILLCAVAIAEDRPLAASRPGSCTEDRG